MIYLTQGIVLGLYAAAMPGPFQAFLLAQTLRHGWRRTLPAALAPLVSDAPVVAFSLLALAQLPPWLLDAIRVAGGLFILYLAWGAYTTFRPAATAAPETAPAPGEQGIPASLWKAAFMNILNPSVYLFWGTIGAPIVLEGWQRSAWSGWSFIAGMYGVMIPATAVLIRLFGASRQLGPGARRWLGLGLAGVLCLLGIYQLWQGTTGLLAA